MAPFATGEAFNVRRHRALQLQRGWRRAYFAVAIASAIALLLASVIALHDMRTAGIDVRACFVQARCNAQLTAAMPLPAMNDHLAVPPLRPDDTIEISRSGVHEHVHIVLPARDPRAHAYLSGELSLQKLANSIGWVSVDGDDGFDDNSLRATHVTLAGATLTVDLENDLYKTDIGEEHDGIHRLALEFGAPNHAAVTVRLSGFRFADSAAFSRAPDTLVGAKTAHWNDIAQTTTIALRTIATSAPAPYANLRTAIENAGDREGWFGLVVRLIAMLWIPLSILAALRCFPRRERPLLRRLTMTLLGTTTAVAFGTAFLAATVLNGEQALPAAVLAIAGSVVFLRVAFIVTGIRFARQALIVAAALLAGGILISEISLRGRGLFLAPAIAIACAAIAAIYAAAPRALARACGGNTCLAPIVWSGSLAALILAIGASHVPATLTGVHAIAYPGRSAIEMIAFCATIAPALFGFVVLVLGRGLLPRAPRNLGYWPVIVVLVLATIGVSQSMLGLPIATLAGLVTIPLIALRSRNEIERLATARVATKEDDDPSFDLAVLRADVKTACGARRKLQEKFVSGDLTLTERDAKAKDLDDFIEQSRTHLAERDKDDLLSSLFTSFPFARPLQAARSAAVTGAIVGAIVVSFGLPSVLLRAASSPLMALKLLAVIIVTILGYTIAAAAFVLFLPYFRGNIATTKGLMFALALAVATILPFSLHMPVRQALIVAAPVILFFPLVGAIFDALALRRHAEVLSVPQIFGLAGLGNFAAIGTVFVSAIASALTGQLQHAATVLIGGALKLPPGH